MGMRASIDVESDVAADLQAQAAAAGLSLGDYLRSLLVRAAADKGKAAASAAEFEDCLDRLGSDRGVGGRLPSDFSRADILSDHP